MKTRKAKRFDIARMTRQQLDAMYRECETVGAADGVPLDKADLALHRSAARRGRPRLGRGTKRINVTVEAGLLENTDAYARKLGLTRAALIARGLRAIVPAA